MNEKIILKVLKSAGKPLKFNEISDRLMLTHKKERTKLKRLLKSLSKNGKIHITKNHTYCLSEEANLVKGKIDFNPHGFAFLIPDDSYKDLPDIFLKPGTLLEALNNDTALVRIDRFRQNGKPEGTVVKILERGLEQVVGVFQKNKDFGFVTPLDKKIIRDFYIPKDKFKKARNNDVVIVKILKYPTKSYNPVGEIIKVLGKENQTKTLLSTVNIKYGIKDKFDKKVTLAAKELLNKKNGISKTRKDIRNIKFFTIDGAKARDFDDAVAIVKEGEHFRLYVSIADVEYFVKENSVIDKEAYNRGTSVYYPDKVFPMLPETLSNNLCSLNPFEDKFTFTVEMLIDKSGNIINYSIYKSVMKSFFRATYEEIGKILADNSEDLRKKYEPILPEIFNMLELMEILRKKRFEKGSIDFNLPEVEIEFDENGKVAEIKKVVRNKAHILIEEFMLLANETVANHLASKDIPLLYRVHEPPDMEKLENISNFLAKFGIYSKLNTPKDIQKVLNEVSDKPFEKLVNYLFLRSMKQAVYQPDNIGHYALAKDNYTHFTSPIRRYPDLINHRILRRAINKKITPGYIEKLHKKLPEIGIQCSTKERNAADAEREIVDIFKLQYMENKVGLIFDGTITGVNSFGFFVEIDDILVEGLVPMRNLTDDYYTYVETDYLIRGKRRGNFFRLGDRVKVEVEKVDTLKQHLDFIVIEKLNDNK